MARREDQPRLSIMQQAAFVDDLITRCIMRDGSLADSATLVLDSEAITHLTHLAERLATLAPFEGRIRAMVNK